MDMDAEHLLRLLDDLRREGVSVWLDGGWAIDALIGEQRRPHDDADLVCTLSDVAALTDTLASQGYVLAGGAAPESFELVDADGRQVDVHPVTLTAAGDGRYRMRDGAEWVYPVAGFTGTGVVAGQSVPCLTAEVMMLGHTTGYALDRTHRDDVIALSRICGVAPPSFQVAD
jgi:lincosamide nucleotidyltransferase A/C/D/E